MAQTMATHSSRGLGLPLLHEFDADQTLNVSVWGPVRRLVQPGSCQSRRSLTERLAQQALRLGVIAMLRSLE